MLAVTVGLALGSGSSADAGLIPWTYNAMFGPAYPQYAYYGGYGYGYDAGPVTYSASYGGYTSNCCGQAVTYYGPAPSGCCGSCNPCCGTCGTGGCGNGCSSCGTNYGGDCSSCGGAGCSNCAPSTSGGNLSPRPDNGPNPTLAPRPGETDQFNRATGGTGTGGAGAPAGGTYGGGVGGSGYPGGTGNYNPGSNPTTGAGTGTGTGAGGYQPPTGVGGTGSSIPGSGGNILGPGAGSSIPRGPAPADPGAGAGSSAPAFNRFDPTGGGTGTGTGPGNNNGSEIGNPLYRGTDPTKQNEQGSIPISDGPIAHSYDANRSRSRLVAPTQTLTVTRVVIRGAEPASERIAKK